MGADIHPYLEVKIQDQWVYVGEVYSHRNYSIFSMLSGVRSYSDDKGDYFRHHSVKEYPKDITDDYSKIVVSWGVDGHSHTTIRYGDLKRWIDTEMDMSITSKMINEAYQGNEKLYEKLIQKHCAYTKDWLMIMEAHLDAGATDARVVLFYDN